MEAKRLHEPPQLTPSNAISKGVSHYFGLDMAWAPRSREPFGLRCIPPLLLLNLAYESGGMPRTPNAPRSLEAEGLTETCFLPDLRDCPRRVLGDQRLRVYGSFLQSRQSRRIADIPERNTDIAKQASPF